MLGLFGIGNLDHSVDLMLVFKQVLAQGQVVDCLPLDQTHKDEVGDTAHNVAAFACKAPDLELEPMAAKCLEIFGPIEAELVLLVCCAVVPVEK